MTINTIKSNYDNGYRSEHSNKLRKHFDISCIGIDSYNDNNISFEFKECFSNKIDNQRYKLPLSQVKSTDFFVFSLNHKEFHVIDSQFLLDSFDFKNDLSKIRIGTIRKISNFETNKYKELKKYIKKLKL